MAAKRIARVAVDVTLFFDVEIERGAVGYEIKTAARKQLESMLDPEDGINVPLLPHGRIYLSEHPPNITIHDIDRKEASNE